MGSPTDERGREKDETQHQVTISKPFYMQTTELTQGQWKKVMGKKVSARHSKDGDNYPVTGVSWDDVDVFISKLNSIERTGKYRLPTEAEWEYAARSGGKAEKWAGTNDESNLFEYAWYDKTFGRVPHPVGRKKPNGLGLYDMSG